MKLIEMSMQLHSLFLMLLAFSFPRILNFGKRIWFSTIKL
jgi:hypothetical protein